MLHTLVVLRSDKEPMRFSEIERRVESSATTLSRRLTELENYGLVIRKEITDSKGNRVEYALTDEGVSLHPCMESMFEWVLHRSTNPMIQSLETPCSTQVTTESGGTN
jgi:DNA-binding HxlR family transcriptional regulator